jgi:hypothetical protein
MLGSNPSADSVASTDRGGMLRHPFFKVFGTVPSSGEAPKALNPGGAGAKPPLSGTAQGFRPITRLECSVSSIAVQRGGTVPTLHDAFRL